MESAKIAMLAFLLALAVVVPAMADERAAVGDVSQITLTINNTQNLDYRGYVSCDLQLPDSTIVTDKSACTNFTADSAVVMVVPIPLPTAGKWTVKSCTVWADFASALSEANCFNAPRLFDETENLDFNVSAANATLWTPNPRAVLSGMVLINATVSGVFDSVGWSYSATSQTCSGGPVAELANTSSDFTKDYTGSWNTGAVADKNYTFCIIGTMGGYRSVFRTVNVSTDNYRFTFNPVELGMAVVARTTKQFNLTIKNTGTAADQYVVTCSLPRDWPATMSGGGRTVSCGQQLSLNAQPGESIVIVASINVPSKPIGTEAAFNASASNSQGNRVDVQQLMDIAEVANDAPIASNTLTSPVSLKRGSPIVFRASVTDPNGDTISNVRACANDDCAVILCNMAPTAQSVWSCSAIANETGLRTWWVYANDSMGMYSITEGSEFSVQSDWEPPPLDPNNITNTTNGDPPVVVRCEHSCFASCTSDTVNCIERIDYGRRDCNAGRTCCKEQTLARCTSPVPPSGCSIAIENVSCIWDTALLNFSVNVQARWSGGSYVRVSAAGITSESIIQKPAIFNVRVDRGGVKGIAASVYSTTDATLCTNKSSVACTPPDQRAPPSPVAGAFPISLATVSSFTVGNEAGNAVDGNQFSAWQAQTGLPQWIILDLGQVRTVGGVGLYAASNKPRGFTIETSQNAETWSQIADVHNAAYVNDWSVTQFQGVDARYVRVTITDSDSPATAYEIEIYPGSKTIPFITIIPIGGGLSPLMIVAVALVVALIVLFVLRRRIALWWSYTRG